jgi:hypothetical protein
MRRPATGTRFGATAGEERYAWRHGQWAFSSVVVRMPPGRYCVALWSIDALGRESRRVTDWVRVPGRG